MAGDEPDVAEGDVPLELLEPLHATSVGPITAAVITVRTGTRRRSMAIRAPCRMACESEVARSGIAPVVAPEPEGHLKGGSTNRKVDPVPSGGRTLVFTTGV